MKSLQSETALTAYFQLSAEPGSQVFVAGTFNNWNPTANILKDKRDRGHFKTAFSVVPGTYEYKFIVNGVWTADPKCPDWVPNDCGSLNSVLHV